MLFGEGNVMRIFGILAICALASPVVGQQINTPLQDERLDLPSCLMAIENLQPTYRTHLGKSCLDIPAKVCAVRGTPIPCFRDTNSRLRAFFDKNRPQLPQTISAPALRKIRYERNLAKVDDAFATPIGPVDDLESEYARLAQATVQLFYLARQAETELRP